MNPQMESPGTVAKVSAGALSAAAAVSAAALTPEAELSQLRQFFLGRQPILDRDQHLIGFELLFRDGRAAGANVSDDMAATASVVLHAFNEFGTQQVLGEHKGYVNANAEFLLSDLVYSLPRKQVVLELLETIVVDAPIIERCRELKQSGYSLALDDVVGYSEALAPLLEIVDVVKLDLLQIESAQLPALVRRLRGWPLALLAEKVETREQFRECRALGIDLFQGYHFARPEVLAGRRLDTGRLALLRVLALVANEAETGDIERELKQHPNLTFNLLRLVNSVALGTGQTVSSLKHAIVVLGRKQMQRWIQLLLYAAPKGSADSTNPLMQLAATRARFMEIIAHAERAADRAYQDSVFMTGVLSLLDTVFGVPLRELLGQLSLPQEVKAALLERSGALGRLLCLTEALETDDRPGVARILAELPGLAPCDLMRAEIEARDWANGVVAAAA